jgi:hypothetical protein
MIKLEDNIPIPKRNVKYPFETMKVSQSFVYTAIRGPQAVYTANLKLKPKRFSCRKEGDYYRIWRIK